MGIKKLKAFTLIEMLVVVAVIGLVLPAIFAIVFGIARQQTKIMRLSQVKGEGDYILTVITNNIRNNAISIHTDTPGDSLNEVCLNVESQSPIPSSLYFLDSEGATFGFSFAGNKVSSESSVVATSLLNTDKTIVSNFEIGCTKTATFSNPTVLINFDICYDTGTGTCISTRPEEIANLHYETTVKLRKF